MANTQQYGSTILDYSNEVSRFECTTEVITALTLPTVLTLLTNFETALAPMILGTVVRKQQDVFDNTLPRTLPASENAQRERKWLVVYHDNTTGKIFRTAIPTANLVGHLTPGTDLADLADTEVDAFVTAFEAAFRSPDDSTHGITVERIVAVGRNL